MTEADGTPGQWYLHLFATEQPDLDWTNADVRAEFESILRFWFDRGVDGFRVDVAHGLAKDPEMPDLAGRHRRRRPRRRGPPALGSGRGPRGVPVVANGWPTPIAGDRVFVGEVWVQSPARLARYLRPDELHTAFTFGFLLAPWDAAALREAVVDSIEALAEVGAAAHLGAEQPRRDPSRDPVRGRRGGPPTGPIGGTAHARPPGRRVRLPGRGAGAPRGHRAARRAPPGSHLHPDGGSRGRARRMPRPDPLARVRTPVRSRTIRRHVAPAAGGLGGRSRSSARSPTSRRRCRLYRDALRLRHAAARRRATSDWTWLESEPDVIAFRRPGERLTCVLNVSDAEVEPPRSLAEGAVVLLASNRLPAGSRIPADTAVWYADPAGVTARAGSGPRRG